MIREFEEKTGTKVILREENILWKLVPKNLKVDPVVLGNRIYINKKNAEDDLVYAWRLHHDIENIGRLKFYTQWFAPQIYSIPFYIMGLVGFWLQLWLIAAVIFGIGTYLSLPKVMSSFRVIILTRAYLILYNRNNIREIKNRAIKSLSGWQHYHTIWGKELAEELVDSLLWPEEFDINRLPVKEASEFEYIFGKKEE